MRFGLSYAQRLTLSFAVMPEVDPKLLVADRYLSSDPGCRSLDARLLAMLVYDTSESRAEMSRDLAATSPLLMYRLIEQDDALFPEHMVARAAAALASPEAMLVLQGVGVGDLRFVGVLNYHRKYATR